MISFNSETLLFKSKINASIVSQYFDKKFKFERFDNLAAAIQRLSSELITLWISAIINKTGISDIACSGGVFMNVKINREILDLKEVKTAHFQPSCGDDSLPIGAAYLANKELSIEKWVIR